MSDPTGRAWCPACQNLLNLSLAGDYGEGECPRCGRDGNPAAPGPTCAVDGCRFCDKPQAVAASAEREEK